MNDFDIMPIARYYHTARTAHLERLTDFTPGYFFYTKIREDFDRSQAPENAIVEQVSLFGFLTRIFKLKISRLELPEPMAVRLWPQLLVIHATLFLLRVTKIAHIDIVSYCIENYPVSRKLNDFYHLPNFLGNWISRVVIWFLLKTSRKVAFGTEDSRITYQDLFSVPISSLVETELIWALPTSRSVSKNKSGDVLFLGTFESRKGIHALLQAWEHVLQLDSSAKLSLVGMGHDIEIIRKYCESAPSVELFENEPRAEVFQHLGRAHVLVLLSQPARGWKEQVGLPIVEALASGCEVVSSNQTGISTWLEAHGHRTIASDASPDSLARAIIDARASSRPAASIQGDLPTMDGRLAADVYLFS